MEPVRKKRKALGCAPRTSVVGVKLLTIETETCNPQLHGLTQGTRKRSASLSARTIVTCRRHNGVVHSREGKPPQPPAQPLPINVTQETPPGLQAVTSRRDRRNPSGRRDSAGYADLLSAPKLLLHPGDRRCISGHRKT